MQDKRFFQLVFTPFISSAISGDSDARINHKVMVDRLKEMPAKLRADLLSGLRAELKVSSIKMRSLPSDLRTIYSKKVSAIQSVLDEFSE